MTHPSIAKLADYLLSLNEKTQENLAVGLAAMEVDQEWFASLAPNPLPENTYHRQVLYRGPDFEVVLATWPKGNGTLIHDHGNTNSCGMVRVILGTIYNHPYSPDEHGVLQDAGISYASTGELVPVTLGLIHKMGYAAGGAFAMSLHIYTPIMLNVSYWDPTTLDPVAT